MKETEWNQGKEEDVRNTGKEFEVEEVVDSQMRGGR